MKKRLLFVDDEFSVIMGLQRMLHSMRNEWEMFFVNSGVEALAILADNPIDVVVSDMRMPEMDGAELLEKVMKLYPSTVRIVLSGYSDEQMILRSVKTAHQFIPKPCDVNILKQTINRTCLLREKLSDGNLLDVVTSIKDLPSLPSLYQSLVTEMESPDPSLKKIAEIIGQDLTMTARVLQLVNSSFFGLASKVTHPKQAVALLGINTLKALVLNMHFFSAFHSHPSANFSADHLWKHSLMVGNGARLIIHLESPDPKLEEKAMIAGILHDIGKLPLLELPGHYDRLKDLSHHQKCSSIEAEYQLLGTSHAEVGAYLLGLWGLPDSMLEPVLFHHRPSGLKEKTFSVLTAVHVANALLPIEHSPTYTPDMTGIDIAYLSNINMLSKLLDWQELFYQMIVRDYNEKKNIAGR
ncbi:MAG: hypothetical protein CVU90_01230 [Firmicutes bacterium HGW-Firmicutes-15]|nr:MAG: hypothetical protein CVU90_01230 [Firmicutes bacterium HGW-Firmicutes-15]